jgi:hypothetical protein
MIQSTNNPNVYWFPQDCGWYWFDETGLISRRYDTEKEAIDDLLEYVRRLNNEC